jgi:hypothetical protein
MTFGGELCVCARVRGEHIREQGEAADSSLDGSERAGNEGRHLILSSDTK